MQIFQVDAFANTLFQGNPAAIIPLKEWLPDDLLQDIAMENNLAETAYIVPHGRDYEIRWFTPAVEVALCGHATLASALVVFDYLGFEGDTIIFHTRKSGILKVSRQPDGTPPDGAQPDGRQPAPGDRSNDKPASGRLTLDFPANDPAPAAPPPLIFEALDIAPAPVYRGPHDYMVVLDNQQQIEALRPDMRKIATIASRGVVVTAPGDEVDFVSRCFFPQSGIDEDPVTGSAYTMMTPYWARRLDKQSLTAIQLSRRRGHLDCILAGDRVYISGYAKIFLIGEVFI